MSKKYPPMKKNAVAEPLPLPFNFMEELTRLRAQHTQLHAQRTEQLWSVFTTSPLLLQQLYDDMVARLPEMRTLYTPATLFDTSQTPMDNRIRLTKDLSPLVPPERLYKSLNTLWQIMNRIMRSGDMAAAGLGDKIFGLEQRLAALDKQNVLMPQLLQMYEHVINTSDSVAAMTRSIGAIQNDQVRENMLVLFEHTKPLMDTMFLVSSSSSSSSSS
jgi:hypothetical protein